MTYNHKIVHMQCNDGFAISSTLDIHAIISRGSSETQFHHNSVGSVVSDSACLFDAIKPLVKVANLSSILRVLLSQWLVDVEVNGINV